MAHLRIGLTGGIGSGKSTVAAHFAALGAEVVDTDAIAHALTAPQGAALPAIAQAFGPSAIGTDGALDRAQMRNIVFDRPDLRRRLEAILHPMIADEALRRDAATRAPAVVFDVPLLAETAHWRARVHRIVVVDCPHDQQVQRVMRRSGWTRDAVERVIAQQASRIARRAIADAVLFNGGDESAPPASLADDVRSLWTWWLP